MKALLAAQLVQAQGVGDAVGDALRSVVTFLPKLVGFLVVLLIGWIVARLLRSLVNKVLERLHFDRLVQRGGIDSAMARARFDASGLVAQLVYYAVLLIALQIAFGLFGANPVSDLLTAIVAWLPRAVVAIVIIVVAAAVARAVRDIATRALGGLSYGSMLGKLASWFIIGLGVIAALNQIGVATTVTTPILIALLATVGGVIVVGVGGGLVRPMQERWDGWLTRAENEVQQAKAHAEAYQRGREDAQRTQQMSQPATGLRPGETRETPAHAATMPTPPAGQPVQPHPGQNPPPQQ